MLATAATSLPPLSLLLLAEGGRRGEGPDFQACNDFEVYHMPGAVLGELPLMMTS